MESSSSPTIARTCLPTNLVKRTSPRTDIAVPLSSCSYSDRSPRAIPIWKPLDQRRERIGRAIKESAALVGQDAGAFESSVVGLIGGISSSFEAKEEEPSSLQIVDPRPFGTFVPIVVSHLQEDVWFRYISEVPPQDQTQRQEQSCLSAMITTFYSFQTKNRQPTSFDPSYKSFFHLFLTRFADYSPNSSKFSLIGQHLESSRREIQLDCFGEWMNIGISVLAILTI